MKNNKNVKGEERRFFLKKIVIPIILTCYWLYQCFYFHLYLLLVLSHALLDYKFFFFNNKIKKIIIQYLISISDLLFFFFFFSLLELLFFFFGGAFFSLTDNYF